MPNKISKKEDLKLILQGEHELVLSWTKLRALNIEPFVDERGFESVRLSLKKKDKQ